MTKDPRTLKHIENDMVRANLSGVEFLVLWLDGFGFLKNNSNCFVYRLLEIVPTYAMNMVGRDSCL